MSKEFDISELDKLCKEIDKKGKNIRNGVKRGVTRTANECEKISKELAPVAEVNGGQLKSSIHTQLKEKTDRIEAEVSPNVEYAPYPEFGTGQRGMASKIERPEGVQYRADWKGQDAHPYMYPAYLQTRDKLASNIKKELNKELKGG